MLILLILWPIAELFVAIEVADAIGVLDDDPAADPQLAARDLGAPRRRAPRLGGVWPWRWPSAGRRAVRSSTARWC